MAPGWILVFLHLLGGASWLGASIFANLVVVPYIGRRPPGERPALVRSLIVGPERLVIGSALLAATTGLLLGASSGRIAGSTISLPHSGHCGSHPSSWRWRSSQRAAS
jgi:hypothetical protein